ncbi:MAG: hypothetical protein KZQ64_12020 [gamma proteobacterium symbiont of Bathyaustriella thionipta]|nr:hypothetical protein [gamma proteobacterium symbiont of Bathyaustriella thionipta]MCU7949830.1 hypothetical protein [gamma proteobacterium symbiont of Bathyaustriella thionipta]MCU7954098.1 hypothetical protein [gamma proteobacterium symbiont of Bathyaustriella thionipta]MCU7956404.1 hypothetical protein [gamma proteobacterium symbiont of Bathyaustriella thionipta]MCU7966695.1 hypothetical protein [gamma proteobacterium symbiont of Bathyaustriella thionipta]
MDILASGGEINRIKRLNLIDKNVVEQKIVYKKSQTDEQYILEIIELRPKIHVTIQHKFKKN